jgi:hypothetical protein
MVGTPIIVGGTEREALHRLRDRAAQKPANLEYIAANIHNPAVKRKHMEQMSEQTIKIPLAYLVTFSIENQPKGVFRHMSMSVQREGRVPSPESMWMVAQELGFVGGIQFCTVYAEDLKGHGKAINLLQPLNYVPSPTTGPETAM